MDAASEQGVRDGAEPNRVLVRAGLLTAAVYLATLLFYARGFQDHTRAAAKRGFCRRSRPRRC